MALTDRIRAAAKRQIKDALVSSREKLLAFVEDSGWENVTSGHGTSRDRRTQNQIRPVSPTQNRQILDDLYAGDDLAGKIADKPAEDMIRKWIRLSISSDDEEAAVEAQNAVMQDLDRLDSKTVMRDALVWANVFGGSLVLVAADDGGGDDPKGLAEPLDIDRIREIQSLEVYDRFEVSIHSRYNDQEDLKTHPDKLGLPKTYTIQSGTTGRSAIDAFPIHESRFIRFDGPPTSRRRRNRQDGWHDSAYTKIEQLLSDFGISWASASALLGDFAQAIFKMKGLAEAISEDSGNLVRDRMQIMDLCRSTIRVVPIDAENEDFSRHQTPVSGLAELLEIFMFRVAGAARMPATVLFGRSPAGMNATGESDLSIWYDQVESMQETILRPRLSHLIKLVMSANEGPTKGVVPDSWDFQFNPLWQMSQKEEIEARKTQAETDGIYIENNVISPDDVANSRFGGATYSYETTISTDEGQGTDDSKSREGMITDI